MLECQDNPTLSELNATAVKYPQKCVHELFEEQVARDPQAIAVVCQGQQLSYGELNQRANQVAHHLRKLGVGPESLVAVCLERSLELVIGLLGVWKAGGAYVPLDPVYPAERLAYMCRDSAARVLLTNRKCKPLLASIVDSAICLDADWPLIAGEPTHNLTSLATHDNLAYVMYTSGSTGRPKGAMILQRGLVNYLWWAMKAYGAGPGGSVPVHSSISFDLTVTSLYTPLIAGAQVELLPEEAGGQHLLAALRSAQRRSLIKITPAHLDLLNQLLSPEEMAEVTKVFVIGGEALLAEGLSMWRQFSPDTRLINEYGPTETVVGCCVYEVQAGDPDNGAVFIGRPIANTQLHILDPNLQPVEPGVTGELYIGGAGVARGYWKQPQLTQEAFLPDPFSGDSAARIYKTGDLARYREDGILEYLGRVDNQVKIHGYRIELGEIEAALAGHETVQSCAVVAREDTPGNKQLVGYIVARKNEQATNDELRDFLEGKLPDYMVPARFVFLEALPLTENGKVDRKSLPAPSSDNVLPGGPFVAPRTEIEKVLASVWSELLHVQRIGIHDDFFALGGHSLLAVKAVTRIQDALKLSNAKLSLATFLRAPTVAELAEILGDKQSVPPSWSSLVPVRASGSRPPLFLFHARGGNMLEYQPLVNHLDSEQPVYGLQARGLNGEIVRGATVEGMAAEYVAELQSLQSHGPYFLAGFCLGGLLALEAAQQLTKAGHEVGLLALIQPLRPGVMNVAPSFTMLRYRAAARLETERWHAHRLRGHYFSQRINEVWNDTIARATLAWDNVTHARRDPATLSMRYILRAMSDEHVAAARKYTARPYAGNVVLFLASQQVSGKLGGELWWKDIMSGTVKVCEMQGNQHNLIADPAAAELAKQLTSELAASRTTRPARQRSAA